jgi:hypothetical protein
MMRRSFRFSQYRIECNCFSTNLADSAAAEINTPRPQITGAAILPVIAKRNGPREAPIVEVL